MNRAIARFYHFPRGNTTRGIPRIGLVDEISKGSMVWYGGFLVFRTIDFVFGALAAMVQGSSGASEFGIYSFKRSVFRG
jgi:hypothetical protein